MYVLMLLNLVNIFIDCTLRIFPVAVVLGRGVYLVFLTVHCTFVLFIFQYIVLFHATVSIDTTLRKQLVTCHFT